MESILKSASVLWWLACLPPDQRFVGLSPAQDDGLLRAIKIRSTTSFGVKGTYKYENKYLVGKIHATFRQVSHLYCLVCLLVISRELWWTNQK
jgi:hypothetical protein